MSSVLRVSATCILLFGVLCVCTTHVAAAGLPDDILKDYITLKRLPSATLRLTDGKFVLHGTPKTEAEKDELARMYLSLHVELHRAGVLPRKGSFSYREKESGRILTHESLPRQSISKFVDTKVKKIVAASSRCLEWGVGYIAKMPGCKERWDFKYNRTHPRLDLNRHVVHGVVDEGLTAELKPLRNYFDVIVCTQVFEHLRHPVQAAKNIFALLKPGGLLVFTAPFMEPEHKVPEDHFRYTLQGAESLMHEVGFTTNMSFVGGGSMLASARLAGFHSADFDGMPLPGLLLDATPVRDNKRRRWWHWHMYWGTYIVFQKPVKGRS